MAQGEFHLVVPERLEGAGSYGVEKLVETLADQGIDVSLAATREGRARTLLS